LRFGSVCSGIEAASVAWEPLGWRAAWFSEIEKFPSAVLAHHYPDTPNLGDMTRLRDRDDLPRIDLLVGGTPCQSFSVAGLRGGLDDERGNLALEFCRLAGRSRPRWIVWENVPGVLSSSGGRDFASIVGALAELGYGCCWRVLDAQYYGVAQRRRRVFLVGHLGDWRPAGAVLFERESLRGNPPPSREAGEEAAGGAGGCASHWGGGPHPSLNQSNSTSGIGLSNQELFSQGGGGLVPDVAYPISCGSGGSKFGSGRHNQDTLIATTVVNARETPVHTSDLSLPLGAQDTGHAVAFQQNVRDKVRLVGGDGQIAGALAAEPGTHQQNYIASIQERAVSENPNNGPDGAGFRTDGAAYTLEARTQPQSVATMSAVRRLTPVECERLQGFPDGYTAIPWRGKAPEDCPDGPRYKALGNSMAVPVMRWIGERIAAVDATL
jgi:DNA (cytosine-5)-methyltransferase 1